VLSRVEQAPSTTKASLTVIRREYPLTSQVAAANLVLDPDRTTVLFRLGCVAKKGHGLMFADMFRHFYDYHFFQNRHIWDAYIVPLPQEQFLQPVDYSHSSVCNQILHMINADNVWFSD
jgi:hypothetical protein